MQKLNENKKGGSGFAVFCAFSLLLQTSLLPAFSASPQLQPTLKAIDPSEAKYDTSASTPEPQNQNPNPLGRINGQPVSGNRPGSMNRAELAPLTPQMDNGPNYKYTPYQSPDYSQGGSAPTFPSENQIPEFGKPLPQSTAPGAGSANTDGFTTNRYVPGGGAPQSGGTQEEARVTKLEQQAFGSSYPEHEVPDRLDHLEKEIFGKPTQAASPERIARLEQKLNVKSAFGQTPSAQTMGQGSIPLKTANSIYPPGSIAGQPKLIAETPRLAEVPIDQAPPPSSPPPQVAYSPPPAAFNAGNYPYPSPPAQYQAPSQQQGYAPAQLQYQAPPQQYQQPAPYQQPPQQYQQPAPYQQPPQQYQQQPQYQQAQQPYQQFPQQAYQQPQFQQPPQQNYAKPAAPPWRAGGTPQASPPPPQSAGPSGWVTPGAPQQQYQQPQQQYQQPQPLPYQQPAPQQQYQQPQQPNYPQQSYNQPQFVPANNYPAPQYVQPQYQAPPPPQQYQEPGMQPIYTSTLPQQQGFQPYGAPRAVPPASGTKPAQSMAPVSTNAAIASTDFYAVVKGMPFDERAGDYSQSIWRPASGITARFSRFPIKVRLPQSSPESWRKSLDESMKRWGAYIPLKVASQNEPADIEMTWENHFADNRLLGITRMQVLQGHLQVRVYLLRPTFYPPDIPERVLKNVSLHEMGHAIGLFGHSENPADVMFASELFSGKGKAAQAKPGNITQKDLNTLRKLYEAPPMGPNINTLKPMEWSYSP